MQKYNDIGKQTLLSENQLYKIVYECKKTNGIYINENDWDIKEFFKIIENALEVYSKEVYKNILSDSCITLENDANKLNRYIKIYFDYSEKKIETFLEQKYPLFKDLVGLSEAKQLIKEKVIDPIKHRNIYDKYDIKVGGGILLYGLPGTGKTMFAQAVANEINGKFYSVKSSDIKSKWFGETENKIKELFEEARQQPISVIFFDEFEAIGVSRDKLGAELTANSVVPELLSQMQGFEVNENILLIIAATNRPWDIDGALLRPGRFDSLVYVDLPNYECRIEMIKNNLKKVNIEDDIIDYLGKATNGYNGADIKNICDKLLRIVINKEISGSVNYELLFEDCIEILKQTQSSVLRNDYDKMMIFKENSSKFEL